MPYAKRYSICKDHCRDEAASHTVWGKDRGFTIMTLKNKDYMVIGLAVILLLAMTGYITLPKLG